MLNQIHKGKLIAKTNFYLQKKIFLFLVDEELKKKSRRSVDSNLRISLFIMHLKS